MLRRRLLRFLSVLSLLLSIVLLILWIDSYRTARWLYYTRYTYTHLNGRPWTDTTNYGVLLRRGAVQADRWFEGDIHNFSGDPVVTKFGVPVDVGWRSGQWGEWDWGRLGLTTEFSDLLLIGRLDPPEPQRTWGPFGWGTTVYPVRGRGSGEPPPDGLRTTVFFPIWLPIVITLLPTTLPVRRLVWTAYRRRRALRTGHCTRCGYDLRASRDTCPECGAVIPVRRSAEPTSTELASRLERIECES